VIDALAKGSGLVLHVGLLLATMRAGSLGHRAQGAEESVMRQASTGRFLKDWVVYPQPAQDSLAMDCAERSSRDWQVSVSGSGVAMACAGGLHEFLL
jgi:hypothetical protein